MIASYSYEALGHTLIYREYKKLSCKEGNKNKIMQEYMQRKEMQKGGAFFRKIIIELFLTLFYFSMNAFFFLWV